MKSETAKMLIDNDTIEFRNGDRMLDASTAYTAVEFAEEETERRMQAKAHKIIEEMMGGIFKGDMPRKIADEFIQKLAEE